MKIRLFGIVNDSIVDGEGLRLVIFTQGCPHHCHGCHNPKSHSFEGGTEYGIEDLIALMGKNPLISGITLSGGEPFCQPKACFKLARAAHKRGLNVWCYTGYTFEQLVEMSYRSESGRFYKTQVLDLLREVDVLIDGRYDEKQRSLDLYFKGSRNQRVIDIPKTLEQEGVILYHE